MAQSFNPNFDPEPKKFSAKFDVKTKTFTPSDKPVEPTGTRDYDDLYHKPQINGVILSGNKTAEDLNLDETDNIEFSFLKEIWDDAWANV